MEEIEKAKDPTLPPGVHNLVKCPRHGAKCLACGLVGEWHAIRSWPCAANLVPGEPEPSSEVKAEMLKSAEQALQDEELALMLLQEELALEEEMAELEKLKAEDEADLQAAMALSMEKVEVKDASEGRPPATPLTSSTPLPAVEERPVCSKAARVVF